MTDRSDRRGLAAGYRLEQYEIRDLQAVDRVGLRYAAFDHASGEPVGLREYLPTGAAARREGPDVETESRTDFELGLSSFVADALRLAGIDHPNVARARGHLRANGTVYLVTDPLPETTLATRLEPDRTLSPAALPPILHGLLDGLEAAHRAGLLHGQLSPETIVLDEGNPLLIDFGVAPHAAGTARRAFRPASRFHTNPPNGAFAALEQYADRGQEGPWTDLYALAAVLFRCVTGQAPVDALHRALQEEAVSLRDAAAGHDPPVLAGIEAGLAIRVADRPRNVAAWRELLAPAGDETRRTSPPRVVPNAARTAARGFHRPAAPVTPPAPRVAGRRAARAREDTTTEGGAARWGYPAAALVAMIALLTWVDAGVLRAPAPASTAGTDRPDEPIRAPADATRQGGAPADRPPAAARLPSSSETALRPAPTNSRDQGRAGASLTADPPRPAASPREDGPRAPLPQPVDAGPVEPPVSPPAEAVAPSPPDRETTAGNAGQASATAPDIAPPAAPSSETESPRPRAAVPETRPPAAPEAPPPAHTLTLDLVPADARVSFAEEVPPYRRGMELPPGSYRVLVTRAGYLPELRTVRVSGPTRVTIALQPDSRGTR